MNTFQFKLPIAPSTDDFNLAVSNMPTINDFVLDNNGNQHKLIKQIGRTGGEGSVYLTDTNYACKIYKKEKITKFKENKIQLLIKNSVKVQNVCLPELIAYNNCKEFIGYLMPQAQGTEIKTSIFTPPLFKKKFPQWNRQHLAKVSLNILKKIEELHRYNIILGDINPSNIWLFVNLG